MMPASTKQSGTCFAFPDVCKTPSPGGPVPIPYANFGMVMQCQKTATKVKICNKETATKKSEMPRSQGDEPGTIGGIVSNVNMNKVIFRKCSSKVKAMGNPVAYLSSMTGQNGSNANMPTGTQIAPSQTKVIVGF
jgi:uncharacterized protein DUF4150